MDDYKILLDKGICDQIDKKCYDLISSYGVTHILDVDNFTLNRGFEPCISSIFLYGEGGSYDFIDELGRRIYIHNGTIGFSEISKYSELYLDILRKRRVIEKDFVQI